MNIGNRAGESVAARLAFFEQVSGKSALSNRVRPVNVPKKIPDNANSLINKLTRKNIGASVSGRREFISAAYPSYTVNPVSLLGDKSTLLRLGGVGQFPVNECFYKNTPENYFAEQYDLSDSQSNYRKDTNLLSLSEGANALLQNNMHDKVESDPTRTPKFTPVDVNMVDGRKENQVRSLSTVVDRNPHKKKTSDNTHQMLKYMSEKKEKLLAKGRDFRAFCVVGAPLGIYDSAGPEVSINGLVKRYKKGKARTVWCRHLAEAYTTGVIGRGAGKFDGVSSKSKLARNMDIPDDKDLDKKYKNSTSKEAYYFQISQLPEVIESAVSSMWDKNNGFEKSFTFQNFDHAMSFRFKRKQGGVFLYFYDPNTTNKHRKILVSKPGQISDLSVDEIITPRVRKHIFTRGDCRAAVLLSDKTVKNPKESRVRVYGETSRDLLGLAMRCGHYANNKGTGLSVGDKYIFVNKSKVIIPVAEALHMKQYSALENYLADLFSSDLTCAEIKAELCKDDGSDPFFFLSYWNGDWKAVDIYLKVLLSSNLSFEDKQALGLYGVSSKSANIVGRALRQGHLDVGVVYIKNVLKSNLTLKEKRKMLRLEDEFGNSGWANIPSHMKRQLEEICRQDYQKYLRVKPHEPAKNDLKWYADTSNGKVNATCV